MSKQNWLSPLGLLLSWGLFVPFYLVYIFGLFSLFQIDPPRWLGILIFPPVMLTSTAFTHLSIYLTATLLGIGSIAAALKWERSNRGVRVLLVLGLLAILFYAFVTPYQPAVFAADEYEMDWLTQPGLLDGVAKRAARFSETRPCSYQLLGWSEEGVLYYKAICQANEPAYWAYTPGQAAERVDAIPITLNRDVVSASDAMDWVYAGSVRPASAEPMARELAIRHHEALLSGDGRYLALIARHIYGPEDVLVLQKMTE